MATEARKWTTLIPWGLVAALALYAAGAAAFIALSYWHEPGYQAARHYEEAMRLLGRAGGRSVPVETLRRAYGELVEAARLVPQVRELHDELEALNARFDERGLQVPSDLRLQADAVAAAWLRIDRERQPVLVVGARDRGWAPEQLLGGPRRATRWALPGALVMVLGWAYLRWLSRGRTTQRPRQTARDSGVASPASRRHP